MSERGRSPAFVSKRGGSDTERWAEEEYDDQRIIEEENEELEFDEFEEEDLPVAPDNEEDEFTVSQGRSFFDIPRMASAQRLRSSSGINPNDWPTTRPGSLTRALVEAAQRSKSPLKDIADELEDFDEALLNLTNYALMSMYFCLENTTREDFKDKSQLSKLLHLLWCVLLCCRADKKPQFGMIIATVLSKITTMTKDSSHQGKRERSIVYLLSMFSELVIIYLREFGCVFLCEFEKEEE